MVLNYIWIGFFAIAFLIAAVQLLLGNTDVFPAIMNSTFDNAKTAFEISLGLTGVLSLWMGIMKIGERGGLVDSMARWLSPLLVRLFPEIPAGHPVFGHIFMNFSANMLGLDNAATPLGLKAMEGLQELNRKKDVATNAMIMFLVLNTSGLTIIPVGVMVYRAQMGAAQPTDVFCPILIATSVSTLAGMVVTSLYQRINLFNRAIMTFVLGICLVVSAVIWLSTQVDQATMNLWSTVVANVLLFSIIMAFIVSGVRKRVNVYEAFVEGAKGGFETAVRIIPYLVAILVAIGVFRASGAMDFIVGGIGRVVELCGGSADYVAALPTAIMKPLSGSGARGMMVDAMQQYGADSFVGRLSCVFQGATDTTFYILAVYFGSVGIRHTRHAVAAGLIADLFGIIAAMVVAAIFFG
ncbi:MAG: spore maturation protein [Bacteroidaceae bacterium]|nr:spore maturation protein [Bacteroidaceae bacterium]MBR0544358.1 spore maturation protein [Bacteroidaceae bacterium]